MKIYEINNLWFKYDKNWILEDINFSIEEGIIFTLVGPNGGGKTTLLKLLLKLEIPTKGKILFKGEDIFSIPRNKYRIGYVPQLANYKLLNENILLKVEDVISLGYKKKDILERLEYLFDLLEIKRLKNVLFKELSGGQKQRVLIARALVNSPEVLILDEPVTGLDIKSEASFYSILQDLNKKENMTIIFVTHDLDIVPSISDMVGCLNKRLYVHSEVDDFLNCPVFEDKLNNGLELLIHGKNIPHRLVRKHK